MTKSVLLGSSDPATLIIIVGMPGSGKSTFIENLCKQNPSLSAYDDFQGQAFNDDSDPRLSKHFGPLVADLKSKKTVVVSDVRYCIPAELNAFLSAILGVEPNVILSFKYFENKPEICKQNVIARNRESRVDAELELIDKLSAHYKIPDIDIVPVYDRSIQ